MKTISGSRELGPAVVKMKMLDYIGKWKIK